MDWSQLNSIIENSKKTRIEEIYKKIINIFGEEQMNEDFKVYKLNPNKIKTLDDIIKILVGLDLAITDNSKHYPQVKEFFDIDITDENINELTS